MTLNLNAAPFRAPAPANKAAPGAAPKMRHLEGSSEERKTFPVATGVLDYFPDAIAEVSQISYWGNQKHNPGQVLHWARSKSMDHADCMARHLIERGNIETVIIDGKPVQMRHSAALAWRALANLQIEIETEKNLAKPRGATALPPR